MQTGIPTIHFQVICSFQGRYCMRSLTSFHNWIHPKWHFLTKPFRNSVKRAMCHKKHQRIDIRKNPMPTCTVKKTRNCQRWNLATHQINNKQQNVLPIETQVGLYNNQPNSAYTTPQKYWKAKEGVTFLRTNPAHRSFHNLNLTRVGGVSCPDSGWTHCKRCSPKSPEVRSAQVIEQTKPSKWLSRYLQDILVKLLLDSSINC